MPRIVVVGTRGAGKTTLARRLAARLNCPHIDLDGSPDFSGINPWLGVCGAAWTRPAEGSKKPPCDTERRRVLPNSEAG